MTTRNSAAHNGRNQFADVDIKAFRQQLEHVSALELPDLTHEMICQLRELPLLTETLLSHRDRIDAAATLMAIAWEAGRRYAFIEAIAAIDNSLHGITGQVEAALAYRLGTNLGNKAGLPWPTVTVHPAKL
jgi:hypothetical protein